MAVARLRPKRLREWLAWKRNDTRPAAVPVAADVDRSTRLPLRVDSQIDIAENDPLLAYLTSVATTVDVDRLELDSPAVAALRAANVKLVVPLISQGELIGMLNLGPRLSEQEFSADDRRLLNNLASQAAPAVRVAQLVQEQEAEARERERIEQELRVAQLIQQQFLPKTLPDLSGWQVAAHYQPARAVGGDFYDFIELPDDRVGIVVGDVTDKGVPAALVMASTRSILRSDAARLISPAAVLERANDLLCPDIPEHMFVTCLYMVLEPMTGRVRFANAGHNLPYVRRRDGVVELRATGMPLGLLPGMTYEEREAVLEPGERMLLFSDGLVEAHDPDGEMFGFPRLMGMVGQQGQSPGHSQSHNLIDTLLTALDRFTGSHREQEDDITLVTLERTGTPLVEALVDPPGHAGEADSVPVLDAATPRVTPSVLDDFRVPSESGNERLVMDRVVAAISELGLPRATIERLRTAVSEATMNAIEHGNGNNASLPVEVRVETTADDLTVRITDHGRTRIPIVETPDIDLKLAGEQSPRGWGLFLIQHMVDDMRQSNGADSHSVELVVHLPDREIETSNRLRTDATAEGRV